MNFDKKIYITAAILITLVLSLIFLVILPISRNIKKTSEELISQRNNLSSLEKELESLKGGKISRDSISEISKRINELFIDSEIPVKFINFLEQESASSQLSIEISPISSSKKEADPWPSLSFQVRTDGSFQNFLKFLERIENSPYLIEIISLSLEKSKEEVKSQPLSISAILVIKVFTR